MVSSFRGRPAVQLGQVVGAPRGAASRLERVGSAPKLVATSAEARSYQAGTNREALRTIGASEGADIDADIALAAGDAVDRRRGRSRSQYRRDGAGRRRHWPEPGRRYRRDRSSYPPRPRPGCPRPRWASLMASCSFVGIDHEDQIRNGPPIPPLPPPNTPSPPPPPPISLMRAKRARSSFSFSRSEHQALFLWSAPWPPPSMDLVDLAQSRDRAGESSSQLVSNARRASGH